MLICGLDEVGRGALAGPLMAVASLFWIAKEWEKAAETINSPVVGVDDSKKLSIKKRNTVFHLILRSKQLVDFGLGEVSPEEINQYGIDWANRTAFERAVKDLNNEPNMVLVDGVNPLLGWDISKQRRRPRADGYWWPVGAASILAKVIRDSYMAELALDWPYYGWEKNSGYGSEKHRRGLLEVGVTPEHRSQFIKRILGGQRAE